MTLRAIPIDQFFAEVDETRERKYGPVAELTPLDVTEEARRQREYRKKRRGKMAARKCIDCGDDISGRGPAAKRCKQCSEVKAAAMTGPKVIEVETLLDAFDKVQERRRAIFIERQNQHGSLSINECGMDDLSGVLKLKVARVKQQIRTGVNDSEVLLDSLVDLANYCAIMELKHTGEWELPWEAA